MRHVLISISLFAVAFTANAQYYHQDSKNPEMMRHSDYHEPCRTVMVLPEVNGYNVYKADLHTHSVFSDGKVMPDFRVQEAWNDGLDIMAVTEHIEVRSCERTFVPYLGRYTQERFRNKAKNTSLIAGAPDKDGIMVDLNHAVALAEKEAARYGITIVPGTEITRDGGKVGHFNALFTKDNNSIYDPDPVQAIRNAKVQGALVMHNHPGWHRTSLEYTETEQKAYDEGLIDGVEVMNMSEFYPGIIDRAKERGIFIAANTDIHGSTAGDYRMSGMQRPMTLILAKDKSLASVREALEAGRTVAFAFNTLCGEEALLRDFFSASVSVEVLSSNTKTQTVMVTNNTSIPYIVKRKGDNQLHLDPHSAILLTIGAQHEGIKLIVLNMWCGKDSHPEVEFLFK